MMYGMFPFEGKNNTRETIVAAIVRGKIKTPPKEMQERYSEGLRKISLLLLSQACSIIWMFNFINCSDLGTDRTSLCQGTC
jgi:hypothetical protein